MEDTTSVREKDSGDNETELLQLLRKLQGDQENNPFYVRKGSEPDFTWKITVDNLQRLEKAGMIQPPTSYHTDYRTDPNILEVYVTPKTDQVLKSITVTHTETVTRTQTDTVRQPEELAPPKKPRIDLRGRAGPILIARMKELELDINLALDDAADKNPKYAKGGIMYLRLVLKLRGPELEREKPALYDQVMNFLEKKLA